MERREPFRGEPWLVPTMAETKARAQSTAVGAALEGPETANQDQGMHRKQYTSDVCTSVALELRSSEHICSRRAHFWHTRQAVL